MFWLDTTIIALLVLGAILGAISGLLWQIARIVCVALSVYAAILLNEWATNLLLEALLKGAEPAVARALAYLAVFIAVFLILYHVALVLDQAIRVVNLQPVDRLLGAAMGVCKMALVVAAICLGLTAYPNPTTTEVMEKSKLAPVLAEGMEMVLLVIPQEYKAELCNGLKNLREFARSHIEQTRKDRSEKTPAPDVEKIQPFLFEPANHLE
jgi:membrane protein required for colicin V production